MTEGNLKRQKKAIKVSLWRLRFMTTFLRNGSKSKMTMP